MKNKGWWEISPTLSVSGASYKWPPSISPAAHTHRAGKSESLSGTDTHLTSRGNLNISCSLFPSSLPAALCLALIFDLLFTSSFPPSFHRPSLCFIWFITVLCFGNLHADVFCTQPRATTTNDLNLLNIISWKENTFGCRKLHKIFQKCTHQKCD